MAETAENENLAMQLHAAEQAFESALAERAVVWRAALMGERSATITAMQGAVDGVLRSFTAVVFYGAYLDENPRFQMFGLNAGAADFCGYLAAPQITGTEAAFAAVLDARKRLAAVRLEACVLGISDDWLHIEDWPASATIADRALLETLATWTADCWAEVQAPTFREVLAEWGADPPQVYDLRVRRWRSGADGNDGG